MKETVGIQFRNGGKVYTFLTNGLTLSVGDTVVVETSKGKDCGTVATAPIEMAKEEIKGKPSPVLRKATEADLKKIEKLKAKEENVMRVFREKITRHGLDMKPVGAEFSFDDTKLLFYFTAEGRIDFRELVKDLASVFHMRIELRQIGVRDEARMLGGLGICGRPYCCSTFLDEFHPVSIKMAKNQDISLNPSKISGACGRLMCCLKYEEDAYEELIRLTPRVGAFVKIHGETGTVLSTSVVSGILRVRLGDRDGQVIMIHRNEVEVLKKPRSGDKRGPASASNEESEKVPPKENPRGKNKRK